MSRELEMEEKDDMEVTFEEVMFTLTSATQDTFSMYMDVELFAGKVINKIEPVTSDIVAIVGIGGERVGYVMIAADHDNALKITKSMMMSDDVEDSAIWDAFGELANNIAGVFKNKYNEIYGKVAMGLPLVVAGKISPVGASPGAGSEKTASVSVQQKGAIIPFVSMEAGISFHVMVYM